MLTWLPESPIITEYRNMLARDPGDIVSVLFPKLPGFRKDLGKGTVSPLPLSFDRVNEGRPPTSNARLFKLPLELLSKVLYVPDDSLASLALVNTDCRQLARSRQFASVVLDYSDISLELARHLALEAVERVSNQGRTLFPSLGACIRHLTIRTCPGWVRERHGFQSEAIQGLS